MNRDYPLSPTPKFTYKNREFTKKDSLDYIKGFKSGLNLKSDKSIAGFKHSVGKKSVVGLNDRYNEGFSEGKDIALSKKKTK